MMGFGTSPVRIPSWNWNWWRTTAGEPQNVFADVSAQEEKHKAQNLQTMSGRKTIVLSPHSSQTWMDENRNPNLFRHLRREVGLISTAIWQKTDIGCDVFFRLSLVFPPCFVDPARCPWRGSDAVICREGCAAWGMSSAVMLTWQWREKVSKQAVEEEEERELQDMTESRLCLSFICLSGIAASSVIRHKMFDGSQTQGM